MRRTGARLSTGLCLHTHKTDRARRFISNWTKCQRTYQSTVNTYRLITFVRTTTVALSTNCAIRGNAPMERTIGVAPLRSEIKVIAHHRQQETVHLPREYPFATFPRMTHLLCTKRVEAHKPGNQQTSYCTQYTERGVARRSTPLSAVESAWIHSASQSVRDELLQSYKAKERDAQRWGYEPLPAVLPVTLFQGTGGMRGWLAKLVGLIPPLEILLLQRVSRLSAFGRLFRFW